MISTPLLWLLTSALWEGSHTVPPLLRLQKVLRKTAEHVVEIFENGGTSEDALKFFEANFYTDVIRPTYPIDAFLLNTSIMIELIKKELL